MNKIQVCQSDVTDAIELQTTDGTTTLIGALFHSRVNRLSIEDALKYANLFAAAPDLLEACKMAKDQIEWGAKIRGGLGHFTPVHRFLTDTIEQVEQIGVE